MTIISSNVRITTIVMQQCHHWISLDIRHCHLSNQYCSHDCHISAIVLMIVIIRYHIMCVSESTFTKRVKHSQLQSSLPPSNNTHESYAILLIAFVMIIIVKLYVYYVLCSWSPCRFGTLTNMIHHLSHDYFVSHQSYPDHPPPALPSRKSLRDRWGRSEVGPGISSKSIYAVRAKSGSQICYQPRRPGTKKRCKFGKWEFFSMLFHFLKKVQWHWWLSYRITTSIWLWLSYVPWCPSQTSRSISNQILDDSIHLCRECFGFNSWRGEYSSIADADEEEQQSLLEVGGRSGGRGTSLLDGTEGEGL